jgi:ribosomal protein L31
MPDSPWQDKDRLCELYVEKDLSAGAIGDKLGCTNVTVLDWLDRHDIPIRNPDPPRMTGEEHPRSVSKEELLADYKRVAEKLDKTPSQSEYNKFGKHSNRAIQSHYGSMGSIQDAASLERLRKGRVTIECETCGKEFSVKHAEKDKSRFCSRECLGQWISENKSGENHPNYNQVKFSCEWCGDSYLRAANREGKTRFCSQECLVEWRSREYSGENHPRWKDNGDYYRGPNWHKQRTKARKRDNHECQNCGDEDSELDVHHIIPFSEFDDYKQANQLQNLITLCDSCHSNVEWGNITVQSRISAFVE